jgi:hypothetical protein
LRVAFAEFQPATIEAASKPAAQKMGIRIETRAIVRTNALPLARFCARRGDA